MSRRTRVIAAAVMAPVAIAAVLFLPTPYLAGLLAALLMLGLWEWTLLAGVRERLSRVSYLAANALLMAALVWGSGHGGLFTLKLASLVGAIWWLFALLWLARFDFAAADTAMARVIKLLAGSFSVIPAWAAICWLHASQPYGPGWALFAISIAWAADSGAYFVGVRFGKRKLAPRISPGKSWEGLIGGLISAILLALAVTPLFGLPWSSAPGLVLLTVVTALISVAGDLFESLLKRHAGIKDSSNLIPGHGGLLDRVDSLLAALPVFVVGKMLWLGH
ncbi:MAG TPA: phosphatidate cytidylyltransferase [Arenimonas sp.]|uniref:phosphatidate cytidylyltransferase n=1 Tax=Arenimonas sp. TaxID=1872635 RepID=UPI002CC76138|nr:phosphatidate cytidylyltransferase [Arenimonas sp.]HMB57169.1 phosphatidate cytidylyltransferase [Arenimonas sp.]